MTLQRHGVAMMRAGTERGNADAAALVASRLETPQTVRQRLRIIGTLARSRNARGLKRLGFRRPTLRRWLNSTGGRALLADPTVRILITARQIATLRELAQQLVIDEQGESHHQSAALEDETAARVLYRFVSKPDKSPRALARRTGILPAEVRNTHACALDVTALTALCWLRDEIAKRQR